MKYRLILTLAMALFTMTEIFAQNEDPDFFRSIGKIYVVVAVMVVTFLGIVFYLVYLDRKLKKIEKELLSHNEVL